jgi:hypothetical protein
MFVALVAFMLAFGLLQPLLLFFMAGLLCTSSAHRKLNASRRGRLSHSICAVGDGLSAGDFSSSGVFPAT